MGIGVVELDLPFEGVERWHPVVVGDGGDVSQVDSEVVLGVFHYGILRKTDCGPHEIAKNPALAVGDVPGTVEERNPAVMSLVDEEGLLDLPLGGVDRFVVIANLEAVFEDAAHFGAGESEDHLIHLAGRGPGVHQIAGLGGEGDDGSVGVNSAAPDVADFEGSVQVRDVNGRQLLAFFREDLDAFVEGLVVERVVGGFFAVEVDGGGAGGLGVGGHLEFFASGLLELGEEQGR